MTPQARYIEKYPERQRAYGAVKRALLRGDLIRPKHCGKCTCAVGPASDGRSMIHAHHHAGYNAPLDVEWLCSSCHKGKDGGAVGRRNAKAKLLDQDVLNIRLSDKATGILASRYQVHSTTIQRIRNGKAWKIVDAALQEDKT